MAVSRLFKQIVLGGVALAVIGGGLFTVRLLAEEKAPRMVVEVYQVADLPVWKVTKDASPQYDGKLLVAYIREIAGMGPDDEGTIEEHPSTASLVVRQTMEKHQKISDALERLRGEQHPKERKERIRPKTDKNQAYYDRSRHDELIRVAIQKYEAAKATGEAARKAAELN